MIFYFIIAVIIVVAVSVVFMYSLNKNKLLDMRTVLAVAVSSIIISCAIPFILGGFINISQNGSKTGPGFGIVWAIIISLVVYFTAILLLTVLISGFISTEREKRLEEKLRESFVGKKLREISQKLHNSREQKKKALEEEPQNRLMTEFMDDSADTSGDRSEVAVLQDENIFEKSVDSEQIIDKMGVETIDKLSDIAVENTPIPGIDGAYQDDLSIEEENRTYVIDLDELNLDEEYINSEETADNKIEDNLSTEEYIDRAFALKEKGDFEEAILYYMYALDTKPEKELVFWIILDICVLYKSLGQAELAGEILDGYISNYGEVMDAEVRKEIERNLSYA